MKRAATIYTMAVLSASCSSTGYDASPRLFYDCDDSVVRGTLTNTREGPTQNAPGDFLGHGWFFADVQLSERWVGSRTPDAFKVKYWGHSGLREDQHFVFVLSGVDGDGNYVISRWAPASPRPPLRNRCGGSPLRVGSRPLPRGG